MSDKIDKNTKCDQHQIDKVIDSEVFKILSEPVRINIIRYLVVNGSSDISSIASQFTQDRSVISRHLKLMLEAGILSMQKESRYTVYTFEGLDFLKQLESIVELIRTMMIEGCPEYGDILLNKKK